MQISTKGIRKTYEQSRALNETDFTVEDGEFVTLLGPSGCGKTTFLRIIAGFVQPDCGKVFIGDSDITEMPPNKRGIGMVFQNFALFPHMTVEKNVGFGLRMRGVDKAQIAQKVKECLALVGLSGYEHRYPHQISGGQQQRVAIARVLAIEPKVLLLDEPFGALDKKLRVQLQVELKKLVSRLHITSIFVTHDQEEALIMSDRIAIMEAGNIVQYDRPTAIYDHPATEFVASFIGSSNLIEGSVIQAEDEKVSVKMPDLTTIVCPNHFGLKSGDSVKVLVRPENFALSAVGTPGTLAGKVAFVTHLGSYSDFEVELQNGKLIKINQPRTGGMVSFSLGDPVGVSIVNEESCAVYRA